AKQIAVDDAVAGALAHRTRCRGGRELLAEDGDRARELGVGAAGEPGVARDEVVVIIDAAAPPRGGQIEADRMEARERGAELAGDLGRDLVGTEVAARAPREHADPLVRVAEPGVGPAIARGDRGRRD